MSNDTRVQNFSRARARHEHACAMTMHGSVDGVKGLRAVVIGLNVSSMSHVHAHMHASCLRACSGHRQKTAVSGELGDAGQGRRNPRTRAGPMCTLHAHVFMQKWEHVACHVARRRCSGHHERACHMPRGGIKS